MSLQRIWPGTQYFLWITITPAVTSLVSGMLLLEWSSPQFPRDTAAAISSIRSCLERNLNSTFTDQTNQRQPHDAHGSLLKQSVALSSVYHQAAFELRIGRISGALQISSHKHDILRRIVTVKAIKPMMGVVEVSAYCGQVFA